MDLPWGDEKTTKFVTNVGLITSNGPYGYNIMAAEWTHQVSYSPGLIMVNVGFNKATEANITNTKQFGVSLAAFDQDVAASISGGSSGKDVDKIKVLKELGTEFYKGKKIDALMVKGAVLNIECKLLKMEKLGDHTMIVGEALEASANEKKPLIYHRGKYWHLGVQMQKPSEAVRERISRLVEKYKKN
ncbi:MAG: flavin reductase family protein [Candidatus Aenigmarchaeota archaeon]|nr:flavin reductase family protein [Candidatus Aenigmarchaeota archaeon]